MAAIGAISVFCATMFWGALWSGLTISVLWGWFVVGLFPVPELSIAHALGLGLVLRAAQGAKTNPKKDDRPFAVQMGTAIIRSPMICGILLLSGYIAKAFL